MNRHTVIKLVFVIVGLTLLFGKPVLAQEGKINFTIIKLNELPYENIYFRKGKKATLIESRKGRRSEPYSLTPESEFLELYTESADPEKEYEVIGRSKIPKTSSRLLFFLRKSGENNESTLPIEIFGIDDSLASFPKGSFRFANFMEAPLLIQIDENRIVIKPKELEVVKLKLSKEGAFIPFLVKDMKAEILGGTRLFSHAENREMVLIFPPKKGRTRLDIRYYSEQ